MESTASLLSPMLTPTLQGMSSTASITRLDIVVTAPEELSHLLDEAVQRLIPAALERRQGILVTQLFPDKYTVEVNERILCGVIEEKRINL